MWTRSDQVEIWADLGGRRIRAVISLAKCLGVAAFVAGKCLSSAAASR